MDRNARPGRHSPPCCPQNIEHRHFVKYRRRVLAAVALGLLTSSTLLALPNQKSHSKWLPSTCRRKTLGTHRSRSACEWTVHKRGSAPCRCADASRWPIASNPIRYRTRLKLGSERFDVNAKLPEGATVTQIPGMLQTLLAERFALKFHREPKEMPVFALVLGKPPLKLKESPVPTQPFRRAPSMYPHQAVPREWRSISGTDLSTRSPAGSSKERKSTEEYWPT